MEDNPQSPPQQPNQPPVQPVEPAVPAPDIQPNTVTPPATAQPAVDSPQPVNPAEPAADPFTPQAVSGSLVGLSGTSAPVKKSRKPLIIGAGVALVFVAAIGVSAVMLLGGNTETKQSEAEETTEVADTDQSETPANTTEVPADKEEATTESTASSYQGQAEAFVLALQAKQKNKVDAMISDDFSSLLKQVTGASSFYDYCEEDQFCALLTWVDLDEASVSTEAYTSETNSKIKGKTVIYTVTSTNASASSETEVKISVVKRSGKFVIDLLDFGFSGSSSTN